MANWRSNLEAVHSLPISGVSWVLAVGTHVCAINSSKKRLFGGVKVSRGMCNSMSNPSRLSPYFIVRKSRKLPILEQTSARFPCQNAICHITPISGMYGGGGGGGGPKLVMT